MVRIITDGTADFSRERCQELNIDVVPLTVHFGERSYVQGVDLSIPEFYEMLENTDILPTTAQASPVAFYEIFSRYVEQGDEVLGIFISSAMSGTCQSATLIRDQLGPDRVHIVDSQTVTLALRLLVEEAVKMRDQGLSAAAIAEELEKLKGRVRLFALVGTLKYLKMGGRLSPASAVFGSILGICPIVTIKNGLVESISKARGKTNACAFIRKRAEAEPIDPNYTVIFGHSNSPETMELCKEALAGLYPEGALTGDLGCVVGTHAGPGAAGLVYIAQE